MATIQEDYAMAIDAAIEYDQSKAEPLYLNRLNLERFREYGISHQELQRLINTETESVRIMTGTLEQLLKDIKLLNSN